MIRSIIAALVLGFSSIAMGANITVQNFNDDASQALVVTSSTGVLLPLNSGSVAVGSFSTLSDAQITAAGAAGLSALLADFAAFAGTVATPIRVGDSNAFDTPGFYSAAPSAGLNAANPLVGKSIYTFIGNGATLAASTEIAVIKDDQTFQADAPVYAANAFAYEASTQVLIGTKGANVTNALGSFPSLRLAPVPEPATAAIALLGLGAIGARRRRLS